MDSFYDSVREVLGSVMKPRVAQVWWTLTTSKGSAHDTRADLGEERGPADFSARRETGRSVQRVWSDGCSLEMVWQNCPRHSVWAVVCQALWWHSFPADSESRENCSSTGDVIRESSVGRVCEAPKDLSRVRGRRQRATKRTEKESASLATRGTGAKRRQPDARDEPVLTCV